MKNSKGCIWRGKPVAVINGFHYLSCQDCMRKAQEAEKHEK